MRLISACVAVLALVLGCGRNGEPNSLFDPDYHVRENKVYYLNAVPGKAFQIDGADASSFEVLDGTYARDVYYRQTVIAGADPSAFPAGRAATNCSETSISFAER